MFLAILIRLFIFFIVIAVLRIGCMLIGCRSERAAAEEEAARNDDRPPPYTSCLGPPVIAIISSGRVWKPETPPPTYKHAVRLSMDKSAAQAAVAVPADSDKDVERC